MIPLYPLQFDPIFKEKIWGGTQLSTVLGKECSDISQCGESWEISTVPGDISVVSNGPLKGKRLDHLIHEYRSALVGKRIYHLYKEDFPLLIKFLDAQQDLSIQVHPDDELAQKKNYPFGKTEMWYVVDADPDATLITGFNKALDKETFLSHMENDTLEEVLNREKASAGDVFFIPAGRIHTIGKGILIAEIQQTSDITYRIYDFNRTDANGNKRELHLDDAAEALDYSVYDEYRTRYADFVNVRNAIVESTYFTTNKLKLTTPFVLESDRQSFRILIALDGQVELKWKDGALQMKKGETVLLPASMDDVQIVPLEPSELLEVSA